MRFLCHWCRLSINTCTFSAQFCAEASILKRYILYRKCFFFQCATRKQRKLVIYIIAVICTSFNEQLYLHSWVTSGHAGGVSERKLSCDMPPLQLCLTSVTVTRENRTVVDHSSDKVTQILCWKQRSKHTYKDTGAHRQLFSIEQIIYFI